MSIELTDICKSYPTRNGPTPILKNINLHVAKGEHLGILGQNGAGKSTLIRVLSGSEKPTSGSVVRKMSVSWPLAFGGAFLGALTGIDNVRFVCRLYGVDPEEKLPFVQDFTELGKYLREPVKSYSSGMRARLAFAVSMAVDFDCYLIDEIVAVGDDRFQRKCQLELFEKRAHKAMLFVSHSADFIHQHCDKASVLAAGELTNFDNVDDAYLFYTSHELAMQPHMAESLPEPDVHLPPNAVQLVTAEFDRATSPDEFEAFLAAQKLERVPVFDSCDVVGRLANAGSATAAIAVAKFLTKRRPNEPLFWITLGDANCGQRQHIRGVEAYREALRLDPGSYWGNRNLASEFFNVGRYEEAIPIFEAAMAAAPTAVSRLELQLRWLDCCTLLDLVTAADRIDYSVPTGAVVVMDQSCAALRDGRSARVAVAGLAPGSNDGASLTCTFRVRGQSWRAQPSVARSSLRRFARSSGELAFAFVHYGPIAAADSEIEIEIREDDRVVFKGTQSVRRIDDTGGEEGASPLVAARLAHVAHRAEASVLLYGLSERQGAEPDVVPFVENLIAVGLYDEAEGHLRRWLASQPHNHPDRAFVIDLFCLEIARARVPGWRDEIDQLLEAEAQFGESVSVLTNLGHARVADDDLTGAARLYEQASRLAADQEIIHFARGIHTAKLAPEVGYQKPQTLVSEPLRDGVEIVHLFACDAHYFRRFAATLVASSKQKSTGVDLVIHAHIIDPDAASLDLAKRLQDSLGLRFTTENCPSFMTQDTVKRAYFTCARFLVAPQLIREYNCPVLITETDCLMNWEWADLLRYIDGADVGYLQSAMWSWVPWTKVPAGIFLFAPTEAGIEQADYIARFIRYAFEREGSGASDLWTVDQVALWLSQMTPPRESGSVHLPMSSVLTLATGDKENVLETDVAR